jgi:hypothetical protein
VNLSSKLYNSKRRRANVVRSGSEPMANMRPDNIQGGSMFIKFNIKLLKTLKSV